VSAAALELVAADIGGTHARFCLAHVAEGRVMALGDPVTLATAAHAGLPAAWAAFADRVGRPLPRAAALALAAPVEGGAVRFTNGDWVIEPDELASALGVERLTLLNDFAAVAHAVAVLDEEHLAPLCGPPGPLPPEGVVTVVGPGTGLGVAILQRDAHGHRVLPTEGGHVGFAPADAIEDAILVRLRALHGRVSAERVVSGPGLAHIRAALAEAAGAAPAAGGAPPDGWDPAADRALWDAVLSGQGDPLGQAALQRFCALLGGVAGDLALAHGAGGVVVAGGLGLRLRAHLAGHAFAARFAGKGRYRARMERLPVRLLTHPQPGLLGAAVAFVQQCGGEGP
jgi:glucokinase